MWHQFSLILPSTFLDKVNYIALCLCCMNANRRAFSPAFRLGCQVKCNYPCADEYRLAFLTLPSLCTKAEGLVFNLKSWLFSRGTERAVESWLKRVRNEVRLTGGKEQRGSPGSWRGCTLAGRAVDPSFPWANLFSLSWCEEWANVSGPTESPGLTDIPQ